MNRSIVTTTHKEERVVHNNRGYDFVRDCFYVNITVFLYNNGTPVLTLDGKPYSVNRIKRFKSFQEYYDYLNGNIYIKACYFGWKPKADIVKQYKIKKTQLNKKSLCNHTIYDHNWNEQPKREKITLKIEKKYDRKNDNYLVQQIWIDCNNTIIHTQKFYFSLFVDFVHFVCNDLIGMDFSMMPSTFFERIKTTRIDLSGAIEPIPFDEKIEAQEFEFSFINEKNSTAYLESIRPTEGEYVFNEFIGHYYKYYGNQIVYISDLHLDHMIAREKCKTIGDVCNLLEKVGEGLEASYKSLVAFESDGNVCVVIAGDITSSPLVFKLFTNMNYEFWKKAVIILGNHELWNFSGLDMDSIVNEYKKLSPIPISQNEILVFSDSVKEKNHSIGVYINYEIQHITYNEAIDMTPDNLSKFFSSARMVMLAGIGFSGCNQEWNANKGLYKNTLSRVQEIEESEKFYSFYKLFIQATKSVKDRIIVVATHMPIENWSKNPVYEDGVIYISGHTHRNYFYDDGSQRIYADNQNGYHRKNPSFKCIYSDDIYDPFQSYSDGIYEISKAEYINFYRAKKIGMQLNRDYRTIYMLKRKGYYCFLARLATGKLSVLNGGKGKSFNVMSPDFFYDNMIKIIETLRPPLNEYTLYQNKISDIIKSIGGTGRIHGCIVDIDFFTHIFVNPFDLSATGYFAISIVEKWVYQSIEKMLEERTPRLYENYLKMLAYTTSDSIGSLAKKTNLEEHGGTAYFETIIYKASREISKMQKIYDNILSIWPEQIPENDKNNSIDNGEISLLSE